MNIKVPPLSAFSFGGKAVAGDAVEVGEMVNEATAISENYSSTREYLKVSSRRVYVCMYTYVRIPSSVHYEVALKHHQQPPTVCTRSLGLHFS